EPEPPLHIDQLWIGPRMSRRRKRLQRHSTLGTGPRTVLHDLRVHRAGVFRRVGSSLSLWERAGARVLCTGRSSQIPVRRNSELLQTMPAAKVIVLPGML